MSTSTLYRKRVSEECYKGAALQNYVALKVWEYFVLIIFMLIHFYNVAIVM